MARLTYAQKRQGSGPACNIFEFDSNNLNPSDIDLNMVAPL